ncbi:hypothetical protein [Polynucleobacter sp. AP-Melu-500A-A1]|uniref:hypothetical protein n=1 Tax=Polynucleobacter sp. AP-Melu-500A-A1 TaxID=2576929 RepID=UPI001C0E6E5E|nr:hypothetical protein [Polynucleobacter sp. AP-Melu-500A-A1]MBU3631680.1 hypothetical protein [Polynucleobacter sp. AP-Melu-500A-A1]
MRKLLFLCFFCLSGHSFSQSGNSSPLENKSNANIAYELTNPLSDLQIVSLQWNHNRGLGTNQAGTNQTLQIGPRFKIDVSENWNAITRVYINGDKVQNVNGVNNAGMGPTQIETFFTEKSNKETIWGAGPYLQVPAGQSGEFGSRQWGGGIRAVFLTKPKPWTLGIKTYQSWSLGGPTGAGTITSPGTGTTNTFSAWPFMAYVTENAWVYSLDSESTYNYDARRTFNPVNAGIGKVIRIGDVPIDFSVGARYIVSGYPGTLQYPGTPRGWGARAQLTFIIE